MARRTIRTDRLIAVLGVAVIGLGVLALWFTRGEIGREESTTERIRTQLNAIDPALRLQYVVDGRTMGVVCGYAGVPVSPGYPIRVGAPPPPPNVLGFISRRNRMLTSQDPLPDEFRQQTNLECPGFPINIPRKSS